MGYNLYITRAEFWAENQAQPISLKELLALVEEDPALSPVPGCQGAARWQDESVHAEPWFAWENCNVMSKNPDTAVINKMIALAASLRATVQGEEGEGYRGGEEGFTLS